MHMKRKAGAIILIPLIVASLIATVSTLSYLLGMALGLPARMGLPLAARLFGLLVLCAGFSLLIWLLRHRPPIDVLVSTFTTLVATLAKSKRRHHPQRYEPLIITGPHRFIRHPLYTAAVILLIGWWLLLDYTFVLICAAFMAFWFSVVVAPFEERELRALFGAQYEAYARSTPRFIPALRLRRRAKPDK